VYILTKCRLFVPCPLGTHTVSYYIVVRKRAVPRSGATVPITRRSGVSGAPCVQRFIRFMIWKPYCEMRACWFLAWSRPFPWKRPRGMVESIRGRPSGMTTHIVCMFRRSATARIGMSQAGMEERRLIDSIGPPVLFGTSSASSGASFSGNGRSAVPYPMTISSVRLCRPVRRARGRQAIQNFRAMPPRTAERPGSAGPACDRTAAATGSLDGDSTGRELTYGRMLAALVWRWCARVRRRK